MTELVPNASFSPGTKFFAPQARLVTPEGQPIAISGQPISPDIVSVTVTRVHTGISQLEVALNNQRHDASHRPLHPPWRYNKLDSVSFGTRVRVDMRYGNEGWTPMILARITDLAFTFPPAAGAQLTLKGEDLLSLLKAKPAEDKVYTDKQEIEMVEEELRVSGSNLTLASPRTPSPFPLPLGTLTHEKAKTYQQFIESLAERMDYELFVEFDDVAPAQGQGGAARPVSLHFEPARSGTLGDPITLRRGRDIVDFKPAFKVWDVLTQAIAHGSSATQRMSFQEEVTMADALAGDLHPAPDGGATPLSAIQARDRAFGSENRPEANSASISTTNMDSERARLQAVATLRKSGRQFLTADVTTIGFPGLRPGIHVNLSGLYPPFDGVYYVTTAVHSLGVEGKGYTTKCSLRRPGMLDPSGYPGG